MTKVKRPSRRNRKAKADRTVIYHAFVDEGLTQRQIARRLDVSDEMIRKQKVKLIEAGFIVEIGNTGTFERGPDAKFFEAAKPIVQTVEEPVADTDGSVQPVQPYRNGGAVEGGTVDASPSGHRDEEVWVPTIAAHMKDGGIIFPVEKVGRITSYLYPTEDGGTAERPFLKESVKGTNNLWQYDGDIALPGRSWVAAIQLQVFTPKKRPRHAHLRIFPARQALTVEEAEEGAEYPLQFFEKDVFDILDHIEKYAGWRFARHASRRVGRKDGKVEYALPLPEEVKRIIPPNFHGIEGVECHVDESLGKGKHEIESEDLARITAMVRAKEGFERVDAALEGMSVDLQDLYSAIGQQEKQVLQIRNETIGRERIVWEALRDLVIMHQHTVDALTRSEVIRPPATARNQSEIYEPAEAEAGNDARKGGMYQ